MIEELRRINRKVDVLLARVDHVHEMTHTILDAVGALQPDNAELAAATVKLNAQSEALKAALESAT